MGFYRTVMYENKKISGIEKKQKKFFLWLVLNNFIIFAVSK